MAISYEDGGFATPTPASLARGFVFGREAAAYGWVSARLGTLFARGERDLPDQRPPLAPALTKLLLWILIGIAATSAVVVGAGVLVVRIYTGAFG